MRVIIIAMGLLLAGPARAQAPAAPLAIDLAGAERMALANNATLQASRSALDASRWARRASDLAFLPTGGFSSSVTRVDARSLEQANQAQVGFEAILGALGVGADEVQIDPFLYRDTYRSALSLNQEFPLNLHLIGGSRMARAGERAAGAGFRAERDAVQFAVRQAYFRLLAARDLLAVAEAGLAAAENRALLAAEREALGMLNRADRLFWEVPVGAARSDLAGARAAATLAEMDLNRLLGLALETPLAPAPVDETVLARAAALAAESPAALVQRRLAASPRALAVAAGEDLAAAGKLTAAAGLAPSLHFAVNVGWRENDTAALDDYRTWSATALVMLPVFDLPARWTQYRRAAAEERRSRYTADDSRAQLGLAVHAAWHEVQRARESRGHRERAAQQAEATLVLMEDRYGLGHLSEFDLVDVQTAATAARAAAVAARYEELAALAALESLLGGSAAGSGEEDR